MRASAAIVAESCVVTGRTRCSTLRSDPPLTLRATGDETVHLVGSAAGPLGGDDLRLSVTVGAGGRLTVRSAAAAVALPGARGGSSSLAVDVAVGAGARLHWLPEPTILVRGCDHRAPARIDLAVGAELVWREVAVLGRHGETPGSLLQRLRVDEAGRPLARNDLAVGPRWPGSLGPAGVGEARAVATALVVGPAAERLHRPETPSRSPAWETREVRAAVLALRERAALVTVVAKDALPAMATLDAALAPALAPAVAPAVAPALGAVSAPSAS